jgi:hypothetical protein
MTQDEIVEAAIQGHASTRDAIRWAIQREREACARVCEKHAEVYASLPKTLTTDASWAACIDSRDAIRARGEA